VVAALALVLGGGITGAAVASGAGGSDEGHDAQSAAKSWLPPTPQNWPLVVDYSRTPAETVTRGLKHYSETYDTVGGRQHIQVLTADLGDPNLRVGVVEAGDTLTNPADETVSSMANRTHAVAGVNGGYFAINASGRPLGGVISNGRLLKSPTPGFASQLGIRPDGTMVMGPETFQGTITDGTATHALTSVNTVDDVAAGGITEVTPDLGTTPGLTGGTLVLGHTGQGGFTVDSVQTGVTSVPQLAAGQSGLLGGGAGGQWLSVTLHTGDTVGISTGLSPDGDLTQLVSGVDTLVKDGKVYQDPTGTPPSGVNPETAVGISQDGRHAIVVAVDGHGGPTTAFGVTPEQAAGYMVAHGAYTAMLFDGGGSTTMATRAPGAGQVAVVNTPSDLPGNTERPVANGIFFYSTAEQPGPAVKTVVNGGDGVTTVTGGSIPVPAYAVDRLGNPAAGSVQVRIEPPSLAAYQDGKLTPLRAGTGRIIATDGDATSSEKLDVVSTLDTLAVSPNAPDLGSGATQQLTLTGTVKDGTAVQIPAEAATWTVSPSSLGTVDAHGLFTADPVNGGLAQASANVGGATATASVAVGSVSKTIDPMTSTDVWRLSNNTTGKPATLTADPGVVPPESTESGSLRLDYTMPAGAGVKQLVLSPRTTLKTTTSDDGQTPTGIGVWIKGNGSGIELAESYIGVNGAKTTLYPTYVTWNGWHLAVADLPAGLQFPLTISFVDFLAISPSTTTGGSLNVSGLQALYSARPITTPAYQAIPQNPSWLHFEEDSADFATKGTTLLTGDDAHLLASDPGSVSSNVMDSIAGRLPALSPQARPDAAQFLGDMADDGKLADLQFAKTKMDALGIPERDIVGNHEITQGADAENGNYSQTFGATHYAYDEGAARLIVTDNSHGSLQSSDPFQDPQGEQYPWLVQQLTDATAKDVFVVTHMPAYDPHPAANSQFTDRWEAQMYLRLVQKFQQSHPQSHVIMLYGHARGFSEQILNPQGQSVTTAQGGVPQLTFADLGMPAYAPADQGGIYHFGLIRVGSDGDLQFTVEPALASIAVTAPSAALAEGDQVTLTATGTQTGGDNIPGLTIPIADPASHVWSSDNTDVATVDRTTGQVTAHRAGTVTITVTSGGVTGSIQLTIH
jgi:exopolysaccharide biosynthesis protein